MRQLALVLFVTTTQSLGERRRSSRETSESQQQLKSVGGPGNLHSSDDDNLPRFDPSRALVAFLLASGPVAAFSPSNSGSHKVMDSHRGALVARNGLASRIRVVDMIKKMNPGRVRSEELWDLALTDQKPSEIPKPDGEATDDPAAPLTFAAIRAADDMKAINISAVRVTHLTSSMSFLVNMCGRSKAQINAIDKNIRDELWDNFAMRPMARDGKPMDGWMCIDYGNVVINIFNEDTRNFYKHESLWQHGQPLDLSDVVTPSGFREEVLETKAPDDDDWTLGEDDWNLDDDDWELSDDDWELAKEES